MERETGYYWVKSECGWHIGYWMGKYFVLMFRPEYFEYYESDFEEINENRIIPPNEKP